MADHNDYLQPLVGFSISEADFDEIQSVSKSKGDQSQIELVLQRYSSQVFPSAKLDAIASFAKTYRPLVGSVVVANRDANRKKAPVSVTGSAGEQPARKAGRKSKTANTVARARRK